ncbi:hypothetical protein B0H19DRAFT_1129565, partial [Mycena capillaripes]
MSIHLLASTAGKKRGSSYLYSFSLMVCAHSAKATTYTSSMVSPWSTSPPRLSLSTTYTPTPAPTSNCMMFQSAVIFTGDANVMPVAQGEDQSPRLHPTAHRIRRDSLLASAPLPFPSPPPPYPRAELMTLSPSSPPLTPDHVSFSVDSACYRRPPLVSFPSPDLSCLPRFSAAGTDLILSALRTTFIHSSVASPHVYPSTLPSSPPLSSSFPSHFADVFSPQHPQPAPPRPQGSAAKPSGSGTAWASAHLR